MRRLPNRNHVNSFIGNHFFQEYSTLENANTSIVHCADRADKTVKKALGRSNRGETNERSELSKKDSLHDSPSWVWDPYKHEPRPIDNDGNSIGEDFLQVFKGTVTSGLGKGEEFVSLEGYQEQFIDKLGYKPYPGTLNISLTEKSTERRPRLESQKSIPIDGWTIGDQNFGPAQCYPITIYVDDGSWYKQTHVIVPKRTSHNESELELLSDVRLRDELKLSDGDMVKIMGPVPKSSRVRLW